MNRIFAFAVFLAMSAPVSFAQTARTPEDPSAELRTGGDVVRPSKATRNAAPRSSGTYADWEIWRDVVIPAGQSLNLDSGLDFSYSGAARVSIRSRNADLPNLVIAAYWTVPQAPFWNVVDTVRGDGFAYSNAGGAMFNTYGNRFRLRVTNTGSSTMYLSQLLIFTRGQ